MINNLFIKDISVTNFKCLRKLEATNFGQINLITGRNNSGKTSLLEALYLNLGPTNPTLWMKINSSRGLDRFSPKETTAPFLFYQNDTSHPIEFKVTTTQYSSFRLRIVFRELTFKETTSIGSPKSVSQNPLASILPIPTGDVQNAKVVEFTYTPYQDKPKVTKAFILSTGLHLGGKMTQVFPESIFVFPSGTGGPEDEAKRYDLLNKADQIETLEKSLKIIEPELKRTSLGIENERTMIHVDLGYGLVPLAILGSGSRKLTTILLSLAYASKGVVLIDEIENSFHYSMMEQVWTTIAEFAEKNGTQIFATTHSDECIKAANNVFQAREQSHFLVHRLDRQIDKTEIFSFGKEQLTSILRTGWDVR